MQPLRPAGADRRAAGGLPARRPPPGAGPAAGPLRAGRARRRQGGVGARGPGRTRRVGRPGAARRRDRHRHRRRGHAARPGRPAGGSRPAQGLPADRPDAHAQRARRVGGPGVQGEGERALAGVGVRVRGRGAGLGGADAARGRGRRRDRGRGRGLHHRHHRRRVRAGPHAVAAQRRARARVAAVRRGARRVRARRGRGHHDPGAGRARRRPRRHRARAASRATASPPTPTTSPGPIPRAAGRTGRWPRPSPTPGLTATDIDHVNCHATSTVAGDLGEAKAVQQALGDHVVLTAPKSALGHTVGAAGAVESIVTLLSIRDGVIPATLNLEKLDPGVELDVVAGEPRKVDIDAALCNSFGFGGHNVAVAFTEGHDRGAWAAPCPTTRPALCRSADLVEPGDGGAVACEPVGLQRLVPRLAEQLVHPQRHLRQRCLARAARAAGPPPPRCRRWRWCARATGPAWARGRTARRRRPAWAPRSPRSAASSTRAARPRSRHRCRPARPTCTRHASAPATPGCAVHCKETLVPSTPEIAHSTCGHTAVGDEWTKTTPRASTADLHRQTRIVFPYVLGPWRPAPVVSRQSAGRRAPHQTRHAQRSTDQGV